MYCDKCGVENRDEAEFCVKCGSKLVKGASADISGAEDDVSPSGADSKMDYIERFKKAVSERYEVIRELGRGGMAVVFLAKDKRLERKVALKLLPQEISLDKSLAERFMREAKISAKLSHPNIIQIHDVDKVGEFTYYSMSYIEGISLAQIIKKSGTLSPKIITRLGIQICFALQQAHEKGVIHRDIKPENILVNKKRMPIVVDFGIARAMSDSRLSTTGMFIGTPQYMSPEQIKSGEIDGRSDIYSLGGMLYEMAVGKPAFRAHDTASLMYKQVHETPPAPHEINKKIPEALSAIIMKALAKDPADRPQSAMELGKLLHESSTAPPTPAAETPRTAMVKEAPSEDGSISGEDVERAIKESDESDKTMLMPRPPKSQKTDEPAKEDGSDTVAMKKPQKKKRQKEEKKKEIPTFVLGLVIFGFLAVITFGMLSFLKKPKNTVQLPPVQQTPVSEKVKETRKPPVSETPPAVERKQLQKKEIVKQEPPASQIPEPKVPVQLPKREVTRVSEPVKPRREILASKPVQEETPVLEPVREPVQARIAPQPEVREAPEVKPPVRPEREPERQQLAIRVKPVIPPPETVKKPEPVPAKSTISIQWVKIPGGTFEMGDFIGDIRKELQCRPVHRVTVSPFEMTRNEVTVEQYAVFLRETGHPEPPEWETQSALPERPVIFISWHDAQAFAKWANARLPSEAEWEFASRGGLDKQKFPWGSEPPQNRSNLGNPWENGQGWKKYLMKPGTFSSNRYGLNDMAGNVWEWTADRFGPYKPGLVVNPAGASTGNMRVIRGGAWNSTDSFVRNSVRGPSNPGVKGSHIGFRIVR